MINKLSIAALPLALCVSTLAASPEFTFDDAAIPLNASYKPGDGTVRLSAEDERAGKQSLHFSGTARDASAWAVSAPFKLTPGKTYRLSFWMKKDSGPIAMSFYIHYKSSTDATLSEYLVFQIDRKKLDADNGKWIEFGSNAHSVCLFYPPAKKDSPRNYTTLKGGAFSFPVERFGTAPVDCEIKINVNGLGNLWLNDVRLDGEKQSGAAPVSGAAAKDGLKAAEEEEAKRLMLGTIGKSDAASAAKTDSGAKVVLKEIIPLPEKYERSTEKFPASATNVKVSGPNFTRDGKPVFLLGGEILSPEMCVMLGIDFIEHSSFMSAVSAKKNAKGDIEVSFGDYPYLDSIITGYLRSGTLVYIDLLQGYKIWQSPLLRELRPELFVSSEAFFAWRPEADNGLGQRIRYNNWASVLKHTRKYPVFIYELFNEIAYTDYSPYNTSCFREEMRRKYSVIESANKAWGANYLSFYEVEPPDDKDNPRSPNGVKHPQLRADWLIFTEKRFGDIMKECSDWVSKQDSGPLRVIQSYGGLPFDYQDNHTNPELKVKAEDAYCCEHGGTYFPQWEGAVSEKEILSSMTFEMILDYLCSVSPDKPIIDGECPLSAGIKSASPQTTLADLSGKWRFKASASQANPKFEGMDLSGDLSNDAGVKEEWFRPDFNDSSWAEINVPGMWGNQGFPTCHIGWYRRTFKTPAVQGKVYLCGSELADRAGVYLNGKLILSTKSWGEQFSADITDALKKDGENVLAIQISNRYFKQGFYWGGIRGPLALSKIPFARIPFSADQMRSALWQRAIHGLSGACVSYFYMNEADDSSCALLNPRMFSPDSIPAMSDAKERMNSLGALLLGGRGSGAEVGLTYSLNSFRAHIRKTPGSLESDRTRDYMRCYGGLTFSGAAFKIAGDPDLKKLPSRKLKALIVSRMERAGAEDIAALEKFAADGGVLIVDSVSLTQNNFDGSPLDASALLGAERGGPMSEPPGAVEFTGLSLREKLSPVKPESVSPAARPLTLKTATSAGQDDSGRIFASERRVGKGKVYTVSAEFSAADMSKIYRAVFEKNGITPPLNIGSGQGSPAPYVESHRLARDGRELWCLHNWGAGAAVTVSPSEWAAGSGLYRIRDAVDGSVVKGPAKDGLWSDKDIRDGVKTQLPNERPAALLIERADIPTLTLSGTGVGRAAALGKFWNTLWTPEDNPPNGRVLWFGKTHYSPGLMPSAAALIRAAGFGVDILDSAKIEPSINVLRGTKRLPAKLSDYKLALIPQAYNGLIDEAQAKTLSDYVSNGGSLLMLGVHTHGIHSYNTAWQGSLAKVFGAKITDGALTDGKNCRFGEPRNFNSSNFTEHPVTRGLSSFHSYGCAPLALPSKDWLPLIKKESSDKDVILAVREMGKGKAAVMGDADWLTMDGMKDGDNAVLLANLAAWLTGAPALSPARAKEAVSVPKAEAAK